MHQQHPLQPNSSMQDANKIVRNADVPPIENEKSSVNEN